MPDARGWSSGFQTLLRNGSQDGFLLRAAGKPCRQVARRLEGSHSRMRLKILAAALLLVVGVGAIGYVVFVAPTAGASSAQLYLTATATRTDVVQQAVATGNVEPAALYGLAFGPATEVIDAAGSGSARREIHTYDGTCRRSGRVAPRFCRGRG